jgi:hypothetical protein
VCDFPEGDPVFAKRIGPRSSQPQTLEAQQHCERPFELTVEMDLVAAEPLQLVGVERLAKCLIADQRAICQFLPARTLPSRKRRSPSASAVAGS